MLDAERKGRSRAKEEDPAIRRPQTGNSPAGATSAIALAIPGLIKVAIQSQVVVLLDYGYFSAAWLPTGD
jgi:hypothetical protein